MAFEWVLQARYMDPDDLTGGNRSYGQGETSERNVCLDSKEGGAVTNSGDVSRNLFYFNSDSRIYLGGTSNGISGVLESTNINKQAINRVINFMNDVYFLVGDRVYIYNETSKSWSTSLVLTGKDATRTNSIGLYNVFINNVPTLITAWNTTSSSWRFARLNGVTKQWTTSSEFSSILNPIDTDGGILNEVQHKDRIYFISSNTTTIGWFNFVIGTMGTISWSQTVRHPMDFVTFNGELYCLNKDASSNILIHKINESSTTQATSVSQQVGEVPAAPVFSALSTANNLEGRNLLFVDNVYESGDPIMYAYNITNAFNEKNSPLTGQTKHGFSRHPYKVVGGTLTDFDPVGINGGFMANPFKMGHNQTGASESDVSKLEETILRCHVDQKVRDFNISQRTAITCVSRFGSDCSPPAPDFEVTSEGGGGDFNLLLTHIWQGGSGLPNEPLPNLNGGEHSWKFTDFPIKEARHRALPHEKIGGGQRHAVILDDGNKAADIVFRGLGTSVQNGVVRIFYNIITTSGVPNGTNVSVRWFYDDNLHNPEKFCTPVGTSAGAISGVEIVSIPANSGSLYYFDWDAKNDGLSRYSLFNLNGQISTGGTAVVAISDPAELQGLTFWLEADDEATIISGVTGKVFSWEDKSGASIASGVSQPSGDLRPLYVANANNGLGGIRFTPSSGDFLFSSGISPVSSEPATIFIVYEASSIGAEQTMFSLSLNSSFITTGPSTPSGTIETDAEFYNINTSGDLESLIFESQDVVRTNNNTSTRRLALTSGSTINVAKLGIWTELSFQSSAQYVPSGVLGEGSQIFSDFSVDGQVEPSGLSNITIGRFSGSESSGVYSSAGNNFNGLIYEIAIYDRILVDLEIERFQKYIEAKYSLS